MDAHGHDGKVTLNLTYLEAQQLALMLSTHPFGAKAVLALNEAVEQATGPVESTIVQFGSPFNPPGSPPRFVDGETSEDYGKIVVKTYKGEKVG